MAGLRLVEIGYHAKDPIGIDIPPGPTFLAREALCPAQ
jgi:hypothetical protein